jgi:hypothetical protein
MALKLGTACVPVLFWYQRWLHLWPLPINAFLLVYHRDTLWTSRNHTKMNVTCLNMEIEELSHRVSSFYPFSWLSLKNIISTVKKCGCSSSCRSHIRLRVAKAASSKCSGNSDSRNLLQFGAVKHPSIACGPVRFLANIPHHTLTENKCSTWRSPTWCGFSNAQECEFLVMVMPSPENLVSSANRMLRRTCRHGGRHLQNPTLLVWSRGNRSYTSLHGNSAYTCTWASLHFRQNIIYSEPPFFTFCIRKREGTSLP